MDLKADLKVDIEEVARYLGYKGGKMDFETMVAVEEAQQKLADIATAKFTYRRFSLERHGETLELANTNFALTGFDIKALLAECDACLLVAVTLGISVDGLIRKSQIVDMAEAVVADACASSMVECLCNDVEAQLKADYAQENLYFTDRFSPGYGDMPLECQSGFCQLLESSKNIGLTVSTSGIMLPAKSITAVIGLAKKPQKMKLKGCEYCSFHGDCQYSKIGKRCE